MYLSRIVIRNVRAFEDLEISLASAKEAAATWTLFTGENGTGKTTLLRCIAMGLSGETGASGLLSELYGEWLRDYSKPAEVTLELEELNGARTKHVVTTKVSHTPSGEYNVKQQKSKQFPPGDVFICGYGIGRGVFGTKSYDSYSTIDSVYSLFNYAADLQNPELVVRRIKDQGVEEAVLLNWINEMLMLPPGATKLGRSGITVSGPWGSDITLGALGDGHQGTVTLICDLLHWSLLFDEAIFKQGKLKGIVIIDQLEEHLHPRWQRAMVRLLREQFPGLQFIATTHSPLCAAGTADLPEDQYKLFLLRQESKGVRALSLPSLKGWRADQVLTSEAFGLLTSRDESTEEQLKRLSELESKTERTKEEEDRYQKILAALDREAPPAAEDAREAKIQHRILQLLEDLKTRTLMQ
jgi:energy-coupling factor transporter ATP-binding protein EcfA2